jgi:hypothetical protein
MVRTLAILLVVMGCLPCYAQAKKKPAKEENHLVSVGDRFVTTSRVVVAVDRVEGVELAKSIEAKDKEGITAMLEEKRATTLDVGVTIVVLELGSEAFPREAKSSECRIVKDGKAIGKHPVHFSWFTTAHMKREPAK